MASSTHWSSNNGVDLFGLDDLTSSTRVFTCEDVIKSAKELFQKQSLIESERKALLELNKDLTVACQDLFQLNWINSKQKLNVDQLVACGPDQNPGLHCLHAKTLDNNVFVDASRKLSSLSEEFSEVLIALRNNPKLVAHLLLQAEQNNITNLASVVPIIVSTLYGDCLLPEDQQLVLLLLKELLNHQIAFSDDPRRLLRQGSSTFYRIYKIFIENLRSAKLFLISALRESILSVLIEDESYLEIDPENPTIKYTPQSRPRHPINESNFLQREQTVAKLTNLVIKFIEGINQSMKCFPDDLCWLIRHLHSSLKSSRKSSFDSTEATVICSELIFAHFICHALVNPEQYGIVDTYISDVARFNLMQIAQIIQALAMNQKDLLESKYKDLCSKIPHHCVFSTLKPIFQDSPTDSLPPAHSKVCDVSRSNALITEHDLDELVTFLFNINSASQSQDGREMLSQILSKIPVTYYTVLGRKDLYTLSKNGIGSGEEINLSESTKVKRGLLRRVTKRKQDPDSSTNSLSNPFLSPSSTSISNSSEDHSTKSKNISDTLLTEVLVFNFPNCDTNHSVFMELLKEEENVIFNSKISSIGSSSCEKLVDTSEPVSDHLNNNTQKKSARILIKILGSVDINSCNIPVSSSRHDKDGVLSELECVLKVRVTISTYLEVIFHFLISDYFSGESIHRRSIQIDPTSRSNSTHQIMGSRNSSKADVLFSRGKSKQIIFSKLSDRVQANSLI